MWYWILDLFNSRNFGSTRSPRWNVVRKQHLIKEPLCQVCGTKGNFLKPNEVHHCEPFHLKSELELDFSNIITLCRPHHLLVGHLMSFKSFNKNVREDAKEWRERIKTRP